MVCVYRPMRFIVGLYLVLYPEYNAWRSCCICCVVYTDIWQVLVRADSAEVTSYQLPYKIYFFNYAEKYTKS